jgi:hypothetical protein
MMRKSSNWERSLRRKHLEQMFSTIDFSKLNFAPPDDPDEEEDDEENTEEEDDEENAEEQTTLSSSMEEAIRAIMQANPAIDRQRAIHHLLHSAAGRQLARHLSITMKGTTMTDRAIQLQNIVKSHGGIQAMAKLFVATGKPLGGVTEAEFYSLMNAEAQATRKAGERPATAFDRFYSDPANVDIRKAHQLTRGF